MTLPRLLIRLGAISVLASIGLATISPPIAAIFLVWGGTAALAYPILMTLSSTEKKWADGRGLLRLSLTLLIAASVSVSLASVAQLLLQPELTVGLLNSVGLTAFLLGLGGELLSFLIAQPTQ